jgi:hypothetical protein
MAESNPSATRNGRKPELDELSVRRRNKSLEKARQVLREQRQQKERSERRRMHRRLREIASELNVLDSEYDATFRRAVRLGNKGFDEKEAKAWDDAAAIRMRIMNLRAEHKSLERKTGIAA